MSNDMFVPTNGDQLLQIIEQYESLAKEKEAISANQKDIMAEAKSQGYDTKIIKKIIAIRAKSISVVSEEMALLDIYMNAIGMNV
jgi:uncharacterized protein (UPF0335 family)